MAKPKQISLLERMGFRDEDLTTPLHDEITLWLKDRAGEFAEAVGGHAVYDLERVLEHPITKGDGQYKTIVGYVDLLIQGELDIPVKVPREGVCEDKCSYSKARARCRQRRKSERWRRPGDCPLSVSDLERGTDWRFFVMLCEIKSSIRSIGETMRQIQTYEEYVDPHLRNYCGEPVGRRSFWLVSPDDRAVSAFVEQGIGFVRHPDGHIWTPDGRELDMP